MAQLYVKYDDANWHCEGDFPETSPEEFGGTHIALFMKWCFLRGWIGDLHLEGEPEDTQAVVAGTMSASDFLFKYCDGQLTDEDFDERGNQFAGRYYGRNGLYFTDYVDAFGHLLYTGSEDDHDFQQFSALLEERLRSNVLTHADQAPATKPWWKFW